jgi:hypothetical protein
MSDTSLPLPPAASLHGMPRLRTPLASVLAEPIVIRTCACVGAAQIGLSLARLPAWPCVFYHTTGLPCPGCGLTRSCMSLLRGHPVEALQYHALGPVLLAGILLLAIGSVLPRRHLLRLASAVETFERSTRLPYVLLIAFAVYWPLRLAGIFPLPA